MKKGSNPKAGFSRYENQISSAIVMTIVLISLTIFATVAWKLARLILP